MGPLLRFQFFLQMLIKLMIIGFAYNMHLETAHMTVLCNKYQFSSQNVAGISKKHFITSLHHAKESKTMP